MDNQPQTTNQSATTKVVQPGSACAWGWTSLFFVIMAITGVIVVAIAPICSRPRSSLGVYGTAWIPPYWCEAGMSLGITNVCLACIWAPLILAALSSLSQKTPIEANENQFSCMFIWALILCGSSMFVVLWLALGVTLSNTHGTYNCYYYLSFYSSSFCSVEFLQWIATAEKASRPHKTYMTFVAWTFLLYTVAGIVVPSRTKYWCCPDCKKSCPQTGREDDCNTCVCCMGELPPTPAPVVRPVAVAGAVQMGGAQAGVVLYAGQPVVQMQAQPQMTEVQYWLTYEIGLPNYAPIFIQQGYTHMQSLLFNINNEQDLRRIVPTIEAAHIPLMLNNLNAKRQASQGAYANAAAPQAGYAPTGYDGGYTQPQQT